MAERSAELRNLVRYVPRVSQEWDPGATGRWQELHGTLCYIDISGFTNLSEKLARRGRIGAEELTDVLDHVFGEMLGVAYDRGGDLLKFGGDALLLLFVGSSHEVQACSAAVEMRAALRKASDYRTSAGRLDLRMSIGVHSGPVHLFQVGESHQELILTGPAASMTAEMEETAEAGEILISSSTRAAIPAGSATVRKGAGWLLRWRKGRADPVGRREHSEISPVAVAEALPIALRQYLKYGSPEPEHRIATVGFIKFEGVDGLMNSDGPDAVAGALHDMIRTIQTEADREGVTFLATDIDRDGGKVILVAGVPGAQEDDEGRVLRAARRIVDGAGALDVRIGVNQGHVFAGEIGAEFRATYTVMGDTVNLAARLMAAATPGEIYASPDVLDRSHTLFETTVLEPFYVKGKAAAVQAYAVGEATGSRPVDRGGTLPFTGRGEELATLTAALTDLVAGTGSVVTIAGETGIGKSRLVHEALAAVDVPHHVRIRCEPYASATPYQPLREPVRHLLGVERGDPDKMAASLAAALADLDGGLLPMAPLIADAAAVEIPATPEADAIEPRFRQDRTADLMVELFTKRFDGPVLFDVEDGHWMDEASAHVLERMAAVSNEKPWLVLVTRRDEPGGFNPKSREIVLEPLPDEEARELVIAATEAAPLRPHDVAEIVRRANGLPLFIEEIVRAVRRSGDVSGLPGSLDAVVSSQIDALEPLARRLLSYASVLGQSFPTELLNELIRDEDVELDAATQHQLSGFLDSDGSDRWQFRHSLIRDVAYEGLSFKRRQFLHLRAGEAAEGMAGRKVDAVADVLALHFSRAGDHERTWRYALVAGDRAKDDYANLEAIEQYERAVEAGKRLPAVAPAELSRAWTALGTVRRLAGLFDETLDAYRKASRLVSSDPIAQAVLWEKKAQARERAGNYPLALRDLTSGYRLVETIDSAEAAAIRARLLASGATVRVAQQQKLRMAIKQALEAIEEARPVGERAAMARAYTSLDTAYRWVGESEKAVHGAEALAIYEELDDLGGQGVVAGNMGAEAYFDGRWTDALELYTRSRNAFLKAGNAVQAAVAESAMGELLVNQGRVDEARPLLEDAFRALKASGFIDVAGFAQVQLGRVLSAEGDFDHARQFLNEARAQFIELGETTNALDAAIHLAECQLRAGRATDALETLTEAEDMAAGDASVHAAAMGRMKAKVLADLGKLDDALAAASAGLKEAERHGLPYEVALLLLTQADLTQRAGFTANKSDLERAAGILSGLGVEIEPRPLSSLPQLTS